MNKICHLRRFRAFELSLQAICAIRPLAERLARQDRSLEKQLRNAATSVSLNLAESRGRIGKDRTHFIRIAAGSAEETLACLLVSAAWGYLDESDITPANEFINQVLAISRSLIGG